MAIECYSWRNIPTSWFDTNLTWKEACVIIKIQTIQSSGGNPSPKAVLRKLSKPDKQVLISLITRIDDEFSTEDIEVKSNKIKNNKVKVTSHDMQIFIKELKEIKVNIFI